MQIFIGQIHTPWATGRDDFDYLIVKATEAEVITTVKLEFTKRIVDCDPEELNDLKELLNAESKDDLINWFKNQYYCFSFHIQEVTVNA